MYKVLIDNALMYDPMIKELALINPIVNLEENKAGSFSFTITPNHPKYDSIKKRKSVIQVYQDDELIFSGMCIEAFVDFYKQKKVYCEGELSYLNDSIQRPKKYQNITVRGLLEAYISNHNEQVEEEKQFTVGMVTVTDSNDSLYCFTNMNSTMQELKEDLVDDLGGYFRIRHQDGVKYIDYLADSMNTNSQVIRLGENLVDFKSNLDTTDILTSIIPLGAKLEESAVEGLETRLDIKSVNNGLDYLYSESAVDTFGWINKAVIFDNVTQPSILKSKGQKYLSEGQFENVVIEAKAVDLHFTDAEIERFKLSDQIRVISEVHGLDKLFRLTKQTLNLVNPENDRITLGKTEKVTLSSQTNSANASIMKAIESITPSSTILKQAVDNATQLITNAMGGYVYKTNNELYIMDTNDPKTAKKVWRWNINGLGYSSTGINGEYSLAMTMDGSIIADFIKAGSLKGIDISNGDGTFHVDSEGALSASNASINGVFNSGSDKDYIEIKNGKLSCYMKGIKRFDCYLSNVAGSGNTVFLQWYDDNGSVNGMTSISGSIVDLPYVIINDDLSCNEKSTFYGESSMYGGLTIYGFVDPTKVGFVCVPVAEFRRNVNMLADLTVSGTITGNSGTATSSDRDKKNSFEDLNDETIDFVKKLKPCKFKYNNGTSDRFHHGFIAQEVKQAMGEEDWGLYIDSEENGKSLRYEELISDLTYVVQNLIARIETLEEKQK